MTLHRTKQSIEERVRQKFAEYIKAGYEEAFLSFIGNKKEHPYIKKKLTHPKDVKNVQKFNEFLKEADSIPGLSIFKKHLLYKGIIAEMGSSTADQIDLARCVGRYDFKFGEDVLSDEHKSISRGMEWIEFKYHGDKAPFYSFIFRYNSLRSSKKYKCDGFLLLRGRRVFMLGTHEDTTFIAHLDIPEYPERQAFVGSFKFECIEESIFVEMNFSLQRT